MSLKTILFAFIGLSVSACGTHRLKLINTEYKGKSLIIQGNWVKDEPKGFDLEVTIFNKTEKRLVFSRDQFSCGRGDKIGVIRKTQIDGKMGPIWTLPTNGSEIFYIVCTIGSKAEGPFRFSINDIHEAKKGSLDKGKLIEKSATWTGSRAPVKVKSPMDPQF